MANPCSTYKLYVVIFFINMPFIVNFSAGLCDVLISRKTINLSDIVQFVKSDAGLGGDIAGIYQTGRWQELINFKNPDKYPTLPISKCSVTDSLCV